MAFLALPAWSQVCDVDSDTDVDRLDIDAIMASRNAQAETEDPRDPDGDGVITARDARVCVLQCTLPRCAIVTPSVNTPPVADAGEDQSVFRRDCGREHLSRTSLGMTFSGHDYDPITAIRYGACGLVGHGIWPRTIPGGRAIA
jgi:hypothetical protein